MTVMPFVYRSGALLAIVLVLVVIFGITSGWRTRQEYGIGLLAAGGLLLIIAGLLSLRYSDAARHLRNRPSTHYAADEVEEYLRRDRLKQGADCGVLAWLGTAGLLVLGLGFLLSL